jgi:hypothetical protein
MKRLGSAVESQHLGFESLCCNDSINIGGLLDSREFVAKTKRYAVDDTVELILKSLKSPRLPNVSNGADDTVDPSISQWMEESSRKEQSRSDWLKRLSADDQIIFRNILEECAEKTVFGMFCFIDGVGGDSEGVFEIVEVIDEQRDTLNPENSEMLHDLFSDVCARDRDRS